LSLFAGSVCTLGDGLSLSRRYFCPVCSSPLTCKILLSGFQGDLDLLDATLALGFFT